MGESAGGGVRIAFFKFAVFKIDGSVGDTVLTLHLSVCKTYCATQTDIVLLKGLQQAMQMTKEEFSTLTSAEKEN